MREDATKNEDFLQSQQWAGSDIKIFEKADVSTLQIGQGTSMRSNSFSGNERNRLFMARNGNFDDLTLVSGADFLEDGRSFVLFDYDHDGWLDMGISSTYSPRFRLMRNRLGEMAAAEDAPQFVNVKLVGGNETKKPSDDWSSRDGIGAKVMVRSGDAVRMFQRSCGEGLASQNSSLIHVGISSDQPITSIDVIWPSGKKTTNKDVKPGQTVTIRERGEATE